MADQKYSALSLYAPDQNDVIGINDTSAASSRAVTVSSFVQSATSTYVLFNDFGGAVSTAADQMWVYGASVAGQMRLHTIGLYGDPRPMQRSLFDDSIYLWMGHTSAIGSVMGGTVSNFGTFSSAAPAVGSPYSTRRRATYRTSSATANLNAGITTDKNDYFTGSTSGYGGFFFFARFGLETYASSTRFFIGLTPTGPGAICTSNPSAMINAVGFIVNDNQSTWSFMHSSSGTTTETISGQTPLSTAVAGAGLGYDVYIFSPPINSSRIYYRMDELNTASTIVNSSVANFLPNTTSFAKGAVMCGNLAASSGVANIGIVKLYIETTI